MQTENIPPCASLHATTNPQSSAILSEKSKQCLETLNKLLQFAIEQKKKCDRDSFTKQQLELQLRNLEQRHRSIEEERKPELGKILDLANDIGRHRQESGLRKELRDKLDCLTVELACAKEEIERVRERYREALVASTKNAMKATQLEEELEAAKQQSARAERNALKEARKASQAIEEKNTLAKRCDQLERQLVHAKGQSAARASHISANVGSSSSGFRLKSVDEVASTRRAGEVKSTSATSAPMKKQRSSGVAMQTAVSSVRQIFEEDSNGSQQQYDQDASEFDFR